MTVQSTAIVRYQRPRGFVARMLSFFRATPVVSEPESFDGGASVAGDTAVTDDYPTMNSMSAMAAFPWVRAALLAKMQDVSGLPVIVKDRSGNPKTSGPMVELVRQPASRTLWRWFISQMVLDFELTGDAYALVVGRRRGSTFSLNRLHPNAVGVVAENDMQIGSYEYTQADGRVIRYAWETVVHIRGPSWQDGPRQLLGEGAIRCLHEDLTSELSASRQRTATAKRGHLSFAVMPDGKDGASSMFRDEDRKKISSHIDKMALEGRSSIVFGKPVAIQTLGMSSQSMQQAEISASTREAILAVFQVPPTRVGLPGANYATQRQESKTYWESLIHGPIAAIEDALTWLARHIGDSGDRVEFDTSSIEALQEGKSERLRRVSTHILNGVPAADAYEAEGFADIAERMRGQPAPVEEPRAAAVTRAAPTRAELWRGFIRALHEPIERDGVREVRRMFAQQAQRYAQRLFDVLSVDPEFNRPRSAGHRTRIQFAVIESILAVGNEQTAMSLAMRRWFERSFQRSVEAEIKRLGADITFDPTANPIDEQVAAFVANVGPTTSEAIRQIIEQGVANGDSIATMQQAIMEATAFAPDRALRVARTETTSVVGRGQEAAHQAAIAQGVQLRKEWLTARDGAVRDSHRRMDGQVREIGEDFIDPVTGDSAAHPGAFSSAGQNVNCRCTTLPVVDD